MINSFKKARLISGMTQTELAKTLGVSVNSVCKWEHGKSLPSAKRLKHIAITLGTTVGELLEEVS